MTFTKTLKSHPDRRGVFLLRAPDGRLFYRLGYSLEDAARSLARELGVDVKTIQAQNEGRPA